MSEQNESRSKAQLQARDIPRMILRCTGGRYPGLYAPRLDSHTVVARFMPGGDTVTLRIEDDKQPERWEEFTVSLEALMAWLEGIRRGEA